jgi:hypothetical protein
MKNTNGNLPAMPCSELLGNHGLTKRERFAMEAMQGLLSGQCGDSGLYESAPDWVKNISEASVEFADALLAELERTA